MPKVISRGKVMIDGKEINLRDYDDTRYSTPIPKKVNKKLPNLLGKT